MSRWLFLFTVLMSTACGQGGREAVHCQSRNEVSPDAPEDQHSEPVDGVWAVLESAGLAFQVEVWGADGGVPQRYHGVRGLPLRIDIDGDLSNGELGADVLINVSLSWTPLQVSAETLGGERDDLSARVELSLLEPDAQLLTPSAQRVYLGYDSRPYALPTDFSQSLQITGLLGGQDSAALTQKIESSAMGLRSVVGRYMHDELGRRDEFALSFQMQPVPANSSLLLQLDDEGEVSNVQFNSDVSAAWDLQAWDAEGLAASPDSFSEDEIRLSDWMGEININLSSDVSDRLQLQYRADAELAALSYLHAEWRGDERLEELSLDLQSVPAFWGLDYQPEQGEEPLRLSFAASGPIAQIDLQQYEGDEVVVANMMPLPGELSVCFAGNASCGSHGAGTDGSMQFLANAPMLLNYDARRGDRITQITDMQVQHLTVDFGTRSGFRKGYIYFDTDEYPFHAEIRDEDSSDGFFLRFSPGTWAQDRYLNWKNYVQIDNRRGQMVCPGRQDLDIKAGGRRFDADFVVDALC